MEIKSSKPEKSHLTDEASVAIGIILMLISKILISR